MAPRPFIYSIGMPIHAATTALEWNFNFKKQFKVWPTSWANHYAKILESDSIRKLYKKNAFRYALLYYHIVDVSQIRKNQENSNIFGW